MAEKVTGVNVEGRNYEFLAGQAVRGACTALATDWVKPVTLPEGTLLVDGLIVAVMFVNGTSVGWSGTKTVYSSDGENFFYDQAMTDPVTLPQPECYEIDPVQGDEYLLSCFPVVVYGTHRLPVCDSRGHYAGGALWAAGDTVAALYLDEKFMLLYSVVDEVKLGVPSPVSSNAVARDAVLKSEIADVVAVDNMYSVSSNAVARALSYSTEEHQVGYWTDGKPLYEITTFLRVPANGSYTFSTPSGIKVRDWRGNFFQRSIDNPTWIMHIPYTYIEASNNTFLNIYVFYNAGDGKFYCDFNGTYSPAYYNGYARITYKYTKDSD